MAKGIVESCSTYSVGELVKWYEQYADGYLTKDAGLGVVIRINQSTFFSEPYYTYSVLRNKHGDTMLFPEKELEKVNVL